MALHVAACSLSPLNKGGISQFISPTVPSSYKYAKWVQNTSKQQIFTNIE